VGYSYEVPVGLGNVIEYEVNDEEVFNVDSDIVYDYKSLNKLKKSELLGMLGDVDANLDGRLTKSEVIEYIIKLNKKD
jgi:predicted transcriptional regulator